MWGKYPAALSKTMLKFADKFGEVVTIPLTKHHAVIAAIALTDSQRALIVPPKIDSSESSTALILSALPPHDGVEKRYPTYPKDHPGGPVYSFDRTCVLPFAPTALLRRLLQRVLVRSIPLALWNGGIIFDAANTAGISSRFVSSVRGQLRWEVPLSFNLCSLFIKH